MIFACESKKYHLLAGVGSDASLFGCIYCCEESESIRIEKEQEKVRRFRHLRLPSVISSRKLRNYDLKKISN